jgi:UDP-N-acetylglucosamine 2-epimerase (non-hydrolysing)
MRKETVLYSFAGCVILFCIFLPLIYHPEPPNWENNSEKQFPITMDQTRKRIAIFFGTRPEIIKLAPLINVLRDPKYEFSRLFQVILINSGQHSEMVEQHLDLFELKSDFDLKLMKFNQTLAQTFARVMHDAASILEHIQPHLVLVHGDTNTAVSIATTAFHLKIPVGHVEAGLRSYEFYQPFPEEMNRRMIDMLSSIHFAVTSVSKKSLLSEGVCIPNVFVVGNTGIDAIRHFVKNQPRQRSSMIKIVLTAHRRENIGDPLRSICRAILEILERRKNIEFVVPVHPNPNVYNIVHEYLGGHNRVKLTEPMRYDHFVRILNDADIVLTDSGGIQEECVELGKPVLLLRDTTERSEGIRDGVIKMIGTNKDAIVSNVLNTIDNPPRIVNKHTFGYGNSSLLIAQILKQKLILETKPLSLCTTFKT